MLEDASEDARLRPIDVRRTQPGLTRLCILETSRCVCAQKRDKHIGREKAQTHKKEGEDRHRQGGERCCGELVEVALPIKKQQQLLHGTVPGVPRRLGGYVRPSRVGTKSGGYGTREAEHSHEEHNRYEEEAPRQYSNGNKGVRAERLGEEHCGINEP